MHVAAQQYPNNSTTVRASPTAGASWPLRAGLSALSAVSPALAARAGERLFLSPPDVTPPRREREALAHWERFEVDRRHGGLAAWRKGSGPVVLLVHGWGGRGGQLTSFAPALVAAGCTVVTFDAPAHGASPGRLASVVLFADAVTEVARATGARAAIGHSMGGAAAAWAVARGLELDAVVSIGAPRTPASFFHSFADALGLSREVRAAIRDRVEARVGLRLEDVDVTSVAPRHVAPPMLVVHDHADREVPFDSGAAIAAAWPGARLFATTGLGHRRILRDARVVDEAVSFVAAHLPRCACGRLASDLHGSDAEPRCAGCALSDELWSRSRRAPGR
jgi:pimeloyl-ACP methyl ester carboxylesterase